MYELLIREVSRHLNVFRARIVRVQETFRLLQDSLDRHLRVQAPGPVPVSAVMEPYMLRLEALATYTWLKDQVARLERAEALLLLGEEHMLAAIEVLVPERKEVFGNMLLAGDVIGAILAVPRLFHAIYDTSPVPLLD
jgi:hypothetical protein